jgi:hypothetical protein
MSEGFRGRPPEGAENWHPKSRTESVLSDEEKLLKNQPEAESKKQKNLFKDTLPASIERKDTREKAILLLFVEMLKRAKTPEQLLQIFLFFVEFMKKLKSR